MKTHQYLVERARRVVRAWMMLHYTFGWRVGLSSAAMLYRREMGRE